PVYVIPAVKVSDHGKRRSQELCHRLASQRLRCRFLHVVSCHHLHPSIPTAKPCLIPAPRPTFSLRPALTASLGPGCSVPHRRIPAALPARKARPFPLPRTPTLPNGAAHAQ